MCQCHIFTKVGSFFIAGISLLFAQAPVKLLLGPDSIPIYLMEPVEIVAEAPPPERVAEIRKQWAAFYRLRRNVHLVYPLAKEAARIVREVDNERARLGEKSRDYKRYSKRMKKDLFDKYEPILREMTISQGILLIKLIYRETGIDAYHLIEDYLGGLQASFWQGVARLYGSNLKLKYNPKEEPVIEAIIAEIETGQSADWVIQAYEIPAE